MFDENKEIIIIKTGAIFLADAHENATRRGFWKLLQSLEEKVFKPPQLFLLGDVFDLAVYEISATRSFVRPYAQKLEALCEHMEVFYLEGNHDFSMKGFFSKVRVFDIFSQPVLCVYEKDPHLQEILENNNNLRVKDIYKSKVQKIALLHGDKNLACMGSALMWLRKRWILLSLNIINIFCKKLISNKILSKQLEKNLFIKIKDFDKIAKNRLLLYPGADILIEGHFHQNKIYFNKNQISYFNLASFAHKCTYFVVQSFPEIKFQEKILRSKDV